MYYLIMRSLRERQELISFLKSKGILSVFHYVPLHLSPVGRSAGGKEGDCPITEEMSDRLVRLPFYNELEPSEQNRVIDAVLEFDNPTRTASTPSIRPAANLRLMNRHAQATAMRS